MGCNPTPPMSSSHTSSKPPRPAAAAAAAAAPSTSTSTPPPYWLQNRSRSVSSLSYRSVLHPAPIALEDNTAAASDHSQALWAKHVSILDHVVVSGSGTALGAYVVWTCRVETLDGGPMTIIKRYSEFDELRQKLLLTFPHCAAAMPPLPRKSVISKFRPKFLEKRKAGLSYFLNCVLLNPEFAGSPVLKEFLFS